VIAGCVSPLDGMFLYLWYVLWPGVFHLEMPLYPSYGIYVAVNFGMFLTISASGPPQSRITINVDDEYIDEGYMISTDPFFPL